MQSWELGVARPDRRPSLRGSRAERQPGRVRLSRSGERRPADRRRAAAQGILAVVLSLLGMLAYIWFRFELRFGIGALVAVRARCLHHSGLLRPGGFRVQPDDDRGLSDSGGLLGQRSVSLSSTGCGRICASRVRAAGRRHESQPQSDTVAHRPDLRHDSADVGSLLFLGGEVLRGFAFIMTIGVIAGTYSSIYIASPFTLSGKSGSARGQGAPDSAASGSGQAVGQVAAARSDLESRRLRGVRG